MTPCGASPQVLELLHFSEAYRRAWGADGANASALALWDLVHRLTRSAAAAGASTSSSSGGGSSSSSSVAGPAQPPVPAAAAAAAAGAAAGPAEGGKGARRPPPAALKVLLALLQPGTGVAPRLMEPMFEHRCALGACVQLRLWVWVWVWVRTKVYVCYGVLAGMCWLLEEPGRGGKHVHACAQVVGLPPTTHAWFRPHHEECVCRTARAACNSQVCSSPYSNPKSST